MGWLSMVLGSRVGRMIGAALMIVLSVLTFGKIQRQMGHEEAENDALRDASDRVQRGRDAVRDGRNKPLDERLRENDERWN